MHCGQRKKPTRHISRFNSAGTNIINLNELQLPATTTITIYAIICINTYRLLYMYVHVNLHTNICKYSHQCHALHAVLAQGLAAFRRFYIELWNILIALILLLLLLMMLLLLSPIIVVIVAILIITRVVPYVAFVSQAVLHWLALCLFVCRPVCLSDVLHHSLAINKCRLIKFYSGEI